MCNLTHGESDCLYSLATNMLHRGCDLALPERGVPQVSYGR